MLFQFSSLKGQYVGFYSVYSLVKTKRVVLCRASLDLQLELDLFDANAPGIESEPTQMTLIG